MRWALAGSILLGFSAVSFAAGADQPAAAPQGAGVTVTAEDLFQQGVQLANQGKWAEAATKFEESNRLDPAPGTTVNLADCYEHVGKLASAWTLFVDAAGIFNRRTPPDERGAKAQARADALLPRLSRLTIEVPEASRVKGLVLKRDGAEVGAGQLGTGIAVDAGEHVVEASAPGKKGWSTKVVVEGEAAKVSVSVPALEDAKVEAPPAASGEPKVEAGWPWQKKAALGAGAAGVVGLAVGAITGGIALGKQGDWKSHCTPAIPRVCDATGVQIANDEKATATVSTIGFAVGGALVAAGAVLWLVAPSSAASKEGGPKAAWVAPVVGPQVGVVGGLRW